MIGWVVRWRGLRYRAGRSAAVAALAALAVAAAVLGPGFARAAEQSLLTDALAAPPAGLTVTASGTAAGAPAAHQPTAQARAAVAAALSPELAGLLGEPVAGVDTDLLVTGGSEPVAARLAWRSDVCDHLVVTGDCPAGAGQVLVSERTAGAYGIGVGDRLSVAGRELQVVGTYPPPEPTAAYWGPTSYFRHGGFDPASGAPRTDALFTGAESEVTADPAAVVRLHLTYPLRTDAVGLGTTVAVPVVAELDLHSGLPAVLAEVAAQARHIRAVAPLVVAPLVLLAAVVLALLVATGIEQRAPEIGLARLRGLPPGRVARFGLGEVLVLVVAAAPAGLGLGLAGVELAARFLLAGGVHATLSGPVLAAAGGSLVVVLAAAVLAGRATLRRDVPDLLRQVPARATWRVGAAQAAAVTLAGAALVAALADRSAPLALLVPALLAVVAGLGTARLVRWLARRRLRRPLRPLPAPALVTAALLARDRTGPRVVAVLTVAVTLVGFGGVAWVVAAQARHDHAVAALGADRVYTVLAEHPAALQAAVARADPAGTAMAVVRTWEEYAGDTVELLAVDTTAPVESVAGFAAGLRPAAPAPLWLADQIEVRLDVQELGSEPVRLTVVVAPPGGPPQPVSLGTLAPGPRTVTARLPAGCGGDGLPGCRLLGLGLGRTGAPGPFTATVAVHAIAAGGVELPARLDDPAAWPAARSPAPSAAGSPLVISGGDGDTVVSYADTAPALPVVLAGPAPADDPAPAQLSFFGLAERPEPMVVAGRTDRLPRAGPHGLMFDLEHAALAAERRVALTDRTGLRYEVWAGPDAPADLAQRLAAAGVPVLETESLAGTRAELSRRAPALGWWLYLLAALAALALGFGVLAGHRIAPAAVAGIAGATVRQARRRQLRTLLGAPLLAGTVTGLAAALLVLPGIPLVLGGGG